MHEQQAAASPAVAVISDFDLMVERLAERVMEKVALAYGSVTSEPYLTVKQAAAYLGCEPQRIYDLNSQERLETVKDGSRLLTRRSWIDHYLKEND